MSKSPYEIRLDLLHLATMLLTGRMVPKPHNSHEFVNYEPSTEEIMIEAEKLNEFVTTSSWTNKEDKEIRVSTYWEDKRRKYWDAVRANKAKQKAESADK